MSRVVLFGFPLFDRSAAAPLELASWKSYPSENQLASVRRELGANWETRVSTVRAPDEITRRRAPLMAAASTPGLIVIG